MGYESSGYKGIEDVSCPVLPGTAPAVGDLDMGGFSILNVESIEFETANPYYVLKATGLNLTSNQNTAFGSLGVDTSGYYKYTNASTGGTTMQAFNDAAAAAITGAAFESYSVNDPNAYGAFTFTAKKYDGGTGVTVHGDSAYIMQVFNNTTSLLLLNGAGLLSVNGDGTAQPGFKATDSDGDSTVTLGFSGDDAAAIILGGSAALTLPAFTAGGAINCGGYRLHSMSQIDFTTTYTRLQGDSGSGLLFRTKKSGDSGAERIAITGNVDNAIIYVKPDGSNARLTVADTAITLSTSAPVSNLKLGNAMDANSQNITAIGDAYISNGYGLVVGNSAQISVGWSSELQVLGTGDADSSQIWAKFSNDANGALLTPLKSRATVIGNKAIVQDNDIAMFLRGYVDDGVDYTNYIAQILFQVDDPTPAENQIGGSIVFSTATTGGVVTQALVIDSSQNIITTDGKTLEMGNGAILATGTTDSDTFLIKYKDNTVGLVNAMQIVSAADPYVGIGGASGNTFKFYYSGVATFGDNVTMITSSDTTLTIEGEGARADLNTPSARLVLKNDITSGTPTAGDKHAYIIASASDASLNDGITCEMQFALTAATAGAVTSSVGFYLVNNTDIGTVAEVFRIAGNGIKSFTNFTMNDAATLEMGDAALIATGTAADDLFTLEAYNTNDSSRSEAIAIKNSAVASDTALIGFFGATPVNQPKKADNNNWANISDVTAALAELGLIDAA